MALTYNGVTPTAITYNGTSLTTVIMNGVTVWTSSSGTTYRWQKSYVTQTISYIWSQYNLTNTSYYAEYDWGSATPAGFSDIEGYTDCSFSSASGYSYSGVGQATSESANIVYVGDGTSVDKYWGSGGVLYTAHKSCRYIEQYEMGSYIGEVQSATSNAYPTNGNGGDGYYYIYSRQTTIFSKGANIEVVTSATRTAYPDNGQQSGYWYTYLGTA